MLSCDDDMLSCVDVLSAVSKNIALFPQRSCTHMHGDGNLIKINNVLPRLT